MINTSRRPVVDEFALIQALAEGRLAGDGLDVFEQEPLGADSPFRQFDTVVITPHLAGYSDEARDNFWRLSVEAAPEPAAGRRPRSVVNRAGT